MSVESNFFKQVFKLFYKKFKCFLKLLENIGIAISIFG